jgi:hypothetical protein
MTIIKPERFNSLRETRDKSSTQVQYDTRNEIIGRIKAIIDIVVDEDDLYRRIYADFPLWCALFIDDDEGNPLFPAKWQIEFTDDIDEKSFVWTLCSRKCGKSTIMAAKLAWMLCGPTRMRIIVYAPTHGQAFVYKKMRKFVEGSPYLMERFFSLGNGGNITGDLITSSNGSEVVNRSISISTGGSTIRGEYGNMILVDEIQEIDQDIMDTVVFPSIADKYGKKKLIMIGTPSNYKNPQLESRWDDWGDKATKNIEYSRFTVDWKRAADEGCINTEYVLGQKKNMTPDDFAMEYEARFPDTSQRFFPKEIILSLRDPKSVFIKDRKPKTGKTYIMAADWAKFLNNTQIVVGELGTDGKIAYVDWVEFNPKRERIDYWTQAEKAKELFWTYNVQWFIPDTTTTQDMIVDLLIQDGDSWHGIPRGCLYREDSNKDIFGYKATAPKNWEMWKNHRQLMNTGKIRLPGKGRDPDAERFFDLYLKEHHELQIHKTANNIGNTLREPKNGSKDLAITCAMMSLYVQDTKFSAPLMDIGAFK